MESESFKHFSGQEEQKDTLVLFQGKKNKKKAFPNFPSGISSISTEEVGETKPVKKVNKVKERIREITDRKLAGLINRQRETGEGRQIMTGTDRYKERRSLTINGEGKKIETGR